MQQMAHQTSAIVGFLLLGLILSVAAMTTEPSVATMVGGPGDPTTSGPGGPGDSSTSVPGGSGGPGGPGDSSTSAPGGPGSVSTDSTTQGGAGGQKPLLVFVLSSATLVFFLSVMSSFT